MFRLGREVRSAWPWQAHDLPPTVLSDNAITRAIEHELYRVGARPQLLGGMDIDKPGKDGASLPGGKCPKIEWIQMPSAIPTLEQTLKEASELASSIMRTGRSTSDGVPIHSGNGKLAQLLKRQSELSEVFTPEAEAEYQKVVAQIAEASAEMENTQ